MSDLFREVALICVWASVAILAGNFLYGLAKALYLDISGKGKFKITK